MLARLLLVLTTLLALIGGLAYLKYRQIQKDIAAFSQPMPAPTVSVARVVASSWQPTLAAVGSVQAVQGVAVNNEVVGQVKEILFESGATVTAGQVLLRLDDEVDRADLEGLIAAEHLAAIKLGRNSKLLKDRAVAQGDVDEITAQLDQARSQIKSKQATIDKKTIRAPFSGQLGIRQVDLGQYLAEGSTIVTLQALDPVFVDYRLPERHLSQLAVGQTIQVQVAAYPGRTFEGRIQALSPQIDQGTRSIAIRARLDNPDRALRPGMFAQVTTLLPEQERVLGIPREAVTFNTYGDSVFLIQDNAGKTLVQRRQIRTGAVRGDQVAVLDGLAEGDRVVAAGQVKLSNGQEVQIVPDPAAGQTAGDTQAQPR